MGNSDSSSNSSDSSNTSQRRKELRNEYKERITTGGVIKITNTVNGRYYLSGEINAERFKNRFEFAQITGSCVLTKLQDDWSTYGGKGFIFEVLEEIEMKEDQTTKEFKEDLKVLEEIWAEKYNPDERY
ncbi:GIY-YIG nuclease family protein [Dehalobacter sp. DCM]|uniref:GIY-YIG nuclease family protein n=1 Tax=Dehalobacter sp. DCM TaxID=2907827 RepID=UPI0030813C4C|nr:GIY-YIG nuclease family protein [Dehalobacter sp. DCM]